MIKNLTKKKRRFLKSFRKLREGYWSTMEKWRLKTQLKGKLKNFHKKGGGEVR